MPKEDPISGKQYEESIDGLKRWAANELPHGVPLLYAVVGFAVITTLLYIGVTLGAWIFSWTIPGWTYIAILVLGVFWAFGGWQHGIMAEEDLEINQEPFDEIDL